MLDDTLVIVYLSFRFQFSLLSYACTLTDTSYHIMGLTVSSMLLLINSKSQMFLQIIGNRFKRMDLE